MLEKVLADFKIKGEVIEISVGGAGGNVINNMINSGLCGVNFIAANTDAQALQRSLADTTIQLGAKLTKGLGAGGIPEVARQAATSAPFSTRYLTVSVGPSLAAKCSGVHPSSFFASTSAPFSTRYLTVSVGPLLAAKCSGVQVQHYEKLHLRLVKLLF